jgi:enamine deaminase RidA (YjgF/YER057c/UK114 family)
MPDPAANCFTSSPMTFFASPNRIHGWSCSIALRGRAVACEQVAIFFHCGKRQLMTSTITVISLLLVAVVATAAQKLEKNNPPGLSKPQPGTYTHVVKSGKLLFVAGQTGVNADGKVVGPGMKEQVEQVMANLTAALKSQGADFSHVAKTTTFVTSISEFRSPEVAAVRAKYVGANPPANTLVQVQQLADPAYKVEIEAIAVLP